MPIPTAYRPAIVITCTQQVNLDGWAAGQLAPAVIDAQGTLWVLTNFDGWAGAPGVRSSFTERPGAHGYFDGPALLEGRVLTLEGVAVAVDQPSARRARDIIASVLGDPSLTATLTVTEPGQPSRQMLVRRSAETKTKALGPTHFQWSLILTAPDPRRYATVESNQTVSLPGAGAGGLTFPLVFPLTFGTGSTGGTLTITNNGTIATWPRFTLLGPLTGPTIINDFTGARLVFDSDFSLAVGESCAIDTDARTVFVGAINRRNRLLVAEWFPFTPGDPTTLQFSHLAGYNADARLTAAWRDAWV